MLFLANYFKADYNIVKNPWCIRSIIYKHISFFFLFISDEDGEKSVSVLLDAEESELIFLDKSSAVSCT
jgi:hypothetical protein